MDQKSHGPNFHRTYTQVSVIIQKLKKERKQNNHGTSKGTRKRFRNQKKRIDAWSPSSLQIRKCVFSSGMTHPRTYNPIQSPHWKSKEMHQNYIRSKERTRWWSKGTGSPPLPVNTSKIHPHVEKFSLKTDWKLAADSCATQAVRSTHT